MKRPSTSPAMRLQVLKLFGAVVLCQQCGQSVYIADAEIDHHLALSNTGEHDFAKNMRPLCRACHLAKTSREAFERAKTNRIIKKQAAPKKPGTIKSRGFQGSRKFNGTINWRTK